MRHIGQTVSFIRPDGQSVNGYLARPDLTDGAPAIIVVQEWWGLNNQIRGVADRLGRAGYFALVPDLYRGASTVEQEEAHHLMSKLNFGDAVAQDIRGAVQYLGTLSSRIGITGFCMGGALSLFAACKNPEVGACVVFYGGHPNVKPDLASLKAPVLGLYAEKDGFVTPESVRALEKHLKDLGKRADIHIYPGADHAFFNDERPQVYNETAARDAWRRTIGFFRQHVK